MWGPIASGGDNKTKGVEAGGVVDPALSLLILRCATMIAQKVCVFRARVSCGGFAIRKDGCILVLRNPGGLRCCVLRRTWDPIFRGDVLLL